jgi:ribosomal protein L12E/L44/L45/RPP1/RPP2
MENGEQVVIEKIIEKLDEKQIKELLEHLHRLVGL